MKIDVDNAQPFKALEFARLLQTCIRAGATEQGIVAMIEGHCEPRIAAAIDAGRALGIEEAAREVEKALIAGTDWRDLRDAIRALIAAPPAADDAHDAK